MLILIQFVRPTDLYTSVTSIKIELYGLALSLSPTHTHDVLCLFICHNVAAASAVYIH
jgi:hypothetical protein